MRSRLAPAANCGAQTLGAVFSSPAISEDLAIVGSSDGRLYAIEREGGEIAWSFEVGERVWTSPAVVGGMVYFVSHDGHIYAIREADG